jgi:dienelactone hydrolase
MSCPSCFSGGITTNHPTGTESTIHGIPTYIASPPAGTTPKALIILITDAFGWKFANNRVLADHYAQRGSYLVYVPDFMNGTSPYILPHLT